MKILKYLISNFSNCNRYNVFIISSEDFKNLIPTEKTIGLKEAERLNSHKILCQNAIDTQFKFVLLMSN